jgi:hypothetical protein
MIMDVKTKRMRLGLSLMVLVAFVAVPSMGDQKVSLFKPFTLQTTSVVAADSSPSVGLSDFLLLVAGNAASGQLSAGDPRPTISLTSAAIRIPQKPNLRSAYSKVPYAVGVW